METKKQIKSYEDLVAWQKAYAFVIEIYRATARFPGDERFGLVSQLRRAAVSVPSNIAEGYGRSSRQDYLHFLKIAIGSAYEMNTQLRLAHDLGYLPDDDKSRLLGLLTEVCRILGALISALEERK